MADIKISELGAASAVNSTDIFPMTSAGVTVKATAQQIKNYMGVGNLADLTTDNKTSHVAAINEVDAHADAASTKADNIQAQVSNSGDAYDPTQPYKVGDYVIHDDKLYRCTTACSAGSWSTNQSCFTQDTLVGFLDSINEWGYGTLDTYNYGTLTYGYNNALHLAWVKWQGNGTVVPPSTLFKKALVDNIKPIRDYIACLFRGNYISVNGTEVTIDFSNTPQTWTSGYILYSTK